MPLLPSGDLLAGPAPHPPGVAAAAVRRILLVSYHFPPSEAAGALRWQRLTPLAARLGWEVDAITLAPDLADSIGWERVAELPPSTQIHGVDKPEPLIGRLELAARRAWRTLHPAETVGGGPKRPTSFHRTEVGWLSGGPRALLRALNVLLSYARENAWARAAVESGLEIAARHPHDLVISCGPPHLVHVAGRRLAQALKVPFVMDLRDPWSLQTRLHEEVASPLWFRLADWEEARCVAQADLVVMNTPLAAAEMQAKWPRSRVMAVMNGWDEEPLPSSPWPDQFRVVYAGSIYIDRTPQPFFRAVAGAVRHLGIGPEEFQVRLIGTVEAFGGQSVAGLAAAEGIGEYLRVIPTMPRRETLREYSQAAVLLSLPQDSHLAIPSKVFEYLRQPCWVIAQTTPDSATGEVLRGTSAFVVSPDDVERTQEILVRCFEEFQAGRRPEPIAREGRFSRAAEGAKLFTALESLVGNVPGSS
jgi:hypothetical protein